MLNFIKNLLGGSSETTFANLNSEDFTSKLKETKKFMILDVRHKHEFDVEKIPNAVNMDVMMPNFKDKMEHYDRSKTYFIYCQSGRRSVKACKALAKMGFENLVNLKGGMNQFVGKTV